MDRNRPGPSALPIALAMALALTVPAQDTATSGSRPFVLPPGDHDVFELLRLAGEYLGQDQVVSDDAAQSVRQREIRLQTPLTIEHDSVVPVLSRILIGRGLALASGEEHERWISTLGAERHRFRETAIAIAPADVLAELGTIAEVETRIAVAGDQPAAVASALRPFFAARDAPLQLSFADERLVLRGCVTTLPPACASCMRPAGSNSPATATTARSSATSSGAGRQPRRRVTARLPTE